VKSPKTRCVIGVQWGDEGKGKIVDILSSDADYVVRFQGGGNAGHTVVVGDQKFVLHLIPSGILQKKSRCVIGNGVVVDLVELLNEVQHLRDRNIPVDKKLIISDRAHVVMPYHKFLDKLSDVGKGRIGTTQRGIGPCYSDKAARKGLRVADLYNPKLFRERVLQFTKEKNQILKALYGGAPLDPERILKEYRGYARKIKPFVLDTVPYVNDAIDRGDRVLFEGAQGSMLDLDFGTYPYVTSSNSDACGISSGTGVPPKHIRTVIGVAKAYCTRVGRGPFPTELKGAAGNRLRKLGGEFGATTGRPRRCGWFDGVASRHAVRINGIDELAVTKLDVLNAMDEICIATGYQLNGKNVQNVPTDTTQLERIKPVYRTFPGWKKDLSGIRKFSDLPKKARTYLEFLEKYLKVRITLVSIGRERGETIIRR
jgi:adenylosuccinate synthase